MSNSIAVNTQRTGTLQKQQRTQSNLDTLTPRGFMSNSSSDSSEDQDSNMNIEGDHQQEDMDGWSEDESMDMDMIPEEGEKGEITMSLESYCKYGLYRRDETTFYHMCARAYHLGAMKNVYPSEEVIMMIFTTNINMAEGDLAEVKRLITYNILRTREVRMEEHYDLTAVLEMFDTWTVTNTKKNMYERKEGYAVVGTMVRIAYEYRKSQLRVSMETEWEKYMQIMTGAPYSQYEMQSMHDALTAALPRWHATRNAHLEEHYSAAVKLLSGDARKRAGTVIGIEANGYAGELGAVLLTKAIEQYQAVIDAERSKHKQVELVRKAATGKTWSATSVVLPDRTGIDNSEEGILIEDIPEDYVDEGILLQTLQRGRMHLKYPPIPEAKRLGTTEDVRTQDIYIGTRTRFDKGTVVVTDKFQLIGLLGSVTSEEKSKGISLLQKTKTEVKNFIKHLGAQPNETLATLENAENGIELDEEDFDNNFAKRLISYRDQKDKSGEGDHNSVSVIFRTKNLHHTAPVGTYGECELNDRGEKVPIGRRGSGRVIFDMVQTHRSDNSTFRENKKGGLNYREYTCVALPGTSPLEYWKEKDWTTLLGVWRGCHANAEDKAILATEILVIREYLVSSGLSEKGLVYILDKVWHAFDSAGVPIPRNRPAYTKAGREEVGKRRSEMTIKFYYVDYEGNGSGKMPTQVKLFFESMAMTKEVAYSGLRFEYFKDYQQMRLQPTHGESTSQTHITAITGLRSSLFAHDILEALITNSTNYESLKHLALAIYSPQVDTFYTRLFPTKLLLVWEATEDMNVFPIKVAPLQKNYTGNYSEMLHAESEDTRQDYLVIGNSYKDNARAVSSPGRGGSKVNSPIQKKARTTTTPEKGMTFQTPQTSQSSAISTVSNSGRSGRSGTLSMVSYSPGTEIASSTNMMVYDKRMDNIEAQFSKMLREHEETKKATAANAIKIQALESQSHNAELGRILSDLNRTANEVIDIQGGIKLNNKKLERAKSEDAKAEIMDAQEQLEEKLARLKADCNRLRTEAMAKAHLAGTTIDGASLRNDG